MLLYVSSFDLCNQCEAVIKNAWDESQGVEFQ